MLDLARVYRWHPIRNVNCNTDCAFAYEKSQGTNDVSEIINKVTGNASIQRISQLAFVFNASAHAVFHTRKNFGHDELPTFSKSFGPDDFSLIVTCK